MGLAMTMMMMSLNGTTKTEGTTKMNSKLSMMGLVDRLSPDDRGQENEKGLQFLRLVYVYINFVRFFNSFVNLHHHIQRPADDPGSADEDDYEKDELPQVVVLKQGKHLTEREAENVRRKGTFLHDLCHLLPVQFDIVPPSSFLPYHFFVSRSI